MDKELLRIVIFATGLVIMTVIVVWAYIKNKQHRRWLEDLDSDSPSDDDRHGRSTLGDDDFLGAFDDDDLELDPFDSAGAVKRYKGPELETGLEDAALAPRFVPPSVIQFSVLANSEDGFNGLDLVHAFESAGLQYGNLNIYERLDANRLVDFGVASLVPPGTFPARNLEDYYCPGIVFFMQPGELEDAAGVFDDFVNTVNFVANELDGSVLDHERKPLQDKTIEMFRRSL